MGFFYIYFNHFPAVTH